MVGLGAVGGAVARELSSVGLEALELVDQVPGRAQALARHLGPPAQAATWSERLLSSGDVVVLTVPGPQGQLARLALGRGAHVVSVADAPVVMADLLSMDAEARERDRHVAVGAAFCPGLSCVLARHGSVAFDVVDEIHVAKAGTGGPACASQHHRSMSGYGVEWRDGEWSRPPAGSGRSLCLFPEPVGYRDCYRGRLGDPLLLVPAFTGVRRVSARIAATRRDRVTASLPMLRSPHPEGLLGAVRVELRGWRGSARETCLLGVIDRPAGATGLVAALAAQWCLRSKLSRPERPGWRSWSRTQCPSYGPWGRGDCGPRSSRARRQRRLEEPRRTAPNLTHQARHPRNMQVDDLEFGVTDEGT